MRQDIKAVMSTKSTAVVGVVMIGRNEGERLAACLRSASPLGLPMVYVDSASSDGSQAIARAAGAVVVHLDLALPFTAARPHHEGVLALIEHAPEIEYIQFVDGDCALAPDWIAAAQHFHDQAPGYAVVCGRGCERWPTASLYNYMADIEWNTPVGDAAAFGGDALFRLSAYQVINGFDPALIASEEPELCSRLGEAGWKIRRLVAEMTVHDAAMTHFTQYWRRATRNGFGYAQAWWTTRHRTRPLYALELFRAGIWTVLPAILAIAGGLALHPALWLLAPLLYVMQVVRIAWRFGVDKKLSWQSAMLLTSSKIAETWGTLRCSRRAMTGSASATISYK